MWIQDLKFQVILEQTEFNNVIKSTFLHEIGGPMLNGLVVGHLS